MPDVRCEARSALEQTLIEAVQALHAAKGEDRIAARKAETAAVKALDAHIKSHGCKAPK